MFLTTGLKIADKELAAGQARVAFVAAAIKAGLSSLAANFLLLHPQRILVPADEVS
jgi:hypothetical protein